MIIKLKITFIKKKNNLNSHTYASLSANIVTCAYYTSSHSLLKGIALLIH